MMRSLYLLFVILLSSQFLFARPSDKIKFMQGEISKIEYDFFAKIDAGDKSLETYYEGFLIASGLTNEASYTVYSTKLNDLRAQAKADLSPFVKDGAFVFAEHLLKWMYTTGGLKKYSLRATLAQDLLDRGEYNCLSSSILYALLYTEFGFEVKGVLTKDHSFCTVITEQGDIDVETTLAYGFNPGKREIEQMSSSQRITYVPKNNYRDRSDVPVATLIASLYANSISLLGRSVNNPYEGLAMYKKGYYLAPDFDFFEKNIVASLNNIAVANVKQNKYEEAMQYFAQAEAFSPGNSITEQNVVYYYNTVGTQYLNKKDYPSAIQTFKEGVSSVGSVGSVLKSNLRVAYYNYAVSEYNAKRYNNASFISDEALLLFPNDRDFLRLKSSIPQ